LNLSIVFVRSSLYLFWYVFTQVRSYSNLCCIHASSYSFKFVLVFIQIVFLFTIQNSTFIFIGLFIQFPYPASIESSRAPLRDASLFLLHRLSICFSRTSKECPHSWQWHLPLYTSLHRVTFPGMRPKNRKKVTVLFHAGACTPRMAAYKIRNSLLNILQSNRASCTRKNKNSMLKQPAYVAVSNLGHFSAPCRKEAAHRCRRSGRGKRVDRRDCHIPLMRECLLTDICTNRVASNISLRS